MAIKTAGELREARGQKPKPILIKIEVTIDEARLLRMASLAWAERTPVMRVTAQSVADKLNKLLSKLDVLTPRSAIRCATEHCTAVVRIAGEHCLDCSGPDIA